MIIVIRKKFIIFSLCFFTAISLVFNFVGLSDDKKAVTASAMPKAYIAVVIDDFGYNGEGTEEFLKIGIPITAAIMPFSDNTAENVEKVHNAGMEMIIHMPMESLTGKPSWIGDKAIRTTMNDEEIKNLFAEAFGIVKYAVGVNNHMGSKIMEDKRSLNALMEIVSEDGLMFLDSKTTANSKSKEVCSENSVSLLNRDVFLDSTDDINVVKKQLRKSAEIALKDGGAIAIGHVGPEGGKVTVKAIKELKTEIEGMGIEFVTLTQFEELLNLQKISKD